MKEIYSAPKMTIKVMEIEGLIAASEYMGRGEGSGGNTPEVKSDRMFPNHSNSVDWEDWE